jgi:hypothetical protein
VPDNQRAHAADIESLPRRGREAAGCSNRLPISSNHSLAEFASASRYRTLSALKSLLVDVGRVLRLPALSEPPGRYTCAWLSAERPSIPV